MRGRYKDYRYANRGQSFEEFLRFANEQYKREGVAVIQKIPTEFIPLRNAEGRVCNVKVKGKSSVDFIGRLGNTPIAIEAKETRSDTIRFDEVQDHQAEFLDVFTAGGAAPGYIVVSFNLDHFYLVPWPFWKAARDAWKDAQWRCKKKAEAITVEHNGQTWTTPGKASVRRSELHPEWEIKTGGRMGLDYLGVYK